tara:strand:+ start:215 stop:388 length:174 start_codon:yes stop_codon:yes gene_type:complete
MGLIEYEMPSKEQVLEWYRRAMRNEINIYDDQNKIIAILAKTLLDNPDILDGVDVVN